MMATDAYESARLPVQMAKALDLATLVVNNSPMTNFAVPQALPRIVQSAPDSGFLLESLMAAVAGSSEYAKDRMRAFLDGRGGRVNRS
jgi:(methylthio)acryloyl-CoA hydratase